MYQSQQSMIINVSSKHLLCTPVGLILSLVFSCPNIMSILVHLLICLCVTLIKIHYWCWIVWPAGVCVCVCVGVCLFVCVCVRAPPYLWTCKQHVWRPLAQRTYTCLFTALVFGIYFHWTTSLFMYMYKVCVSLTSCWKSEFSAFLIHVQFYHYSL